MTDPLQFSTGEHLAAEHDDRRPAKVWRADDGIKDLFPVNERELDLMRKLWPTARGPRLPEEIGVPRLTECCLAGTVGWIQIWEESTRYDGYIQRRVGRECCFYCGQRIGEY